MDEQGLDQLEGTSVDLPHDQERDLLDNILENYNFICHPELRAKFKQQWVLCLLVRAAPGLTRVRACMRAYVHTDSCAHTHTHTHTRRIRNYSLGIAVAKPWHSRSRLRITVGNSTVVPCLHSACHALGVQVSRCRGHPIHACITCMHTLAQVKPLVEQSAMAGVLQKVLLVPTHSQVCAFSKKLQFGWLRLQFMAGEVRGGLQMPSCSSTYLATLRQQHQQHQHQHREPAPAPAAAAAAAAAISADSLHAAAHPAGYNWSRRRPTLDYRCVGQQGTPAATLARAGDVSEEGWACQPLGTGCHLAFTVVRHTSAG